MSTPHNVHTRADPAAPGVAFSAAAAAAIAIALAAATLPSLLAWNIPPSPTFWNQALAIVLWAAFVAATTPTAARSAALLHGALAILVAATLWSWLLGGLPAGLALSALGSLAAASLMVAGGAGGVASGGASAKAGLGAVNLLAALCWGWVGAGALNVVVALLQVFAAELPDGNWVASSGIPGRAVGNLRQPNHLSSLLLWSCIAVIALLDLRRLSRRVAVVAMAAFVVAVVLTASRTGLVSVLLLALWGLLDRRLSRTARGLLLAAPLVYALAWWGMAQWAALSAHEFGGTARLAESDISGSRFAIWSNTLALIRMHPWAGVGLGEFNFAWTLTPFPGRPTAFFDHTHNLPLQLAVELGLPLAALVMGLLSWALARAARLAWRAQGDDSTARRCALMMVLMIGLHSLLEYPLWYAYFLLPTAWVFGYALRVLDTPPPAAEEPGPPRNRALIPLTPLTPPTPPTPPTPLVPLVPLMPLMPLMPPLPFIPPTPLLRIASIAMVAGSLFSVWDYSRVAAIFSADPGAPPLEERITRGQHSLFFAHHADYAAVTSKLPPADPARAFDRTAHYLLDTRLMMAWAQALAEQGQRDKARYIAARLREFGKADAEDFFGACPKAASTPAPGLPFQCEMPIGPLNWQDFVPQR
ncbi:MAG: Wzy polymerase domain-containing protein [Rubrivivax sp.]|nr:Wzy polymerase domain-containing protein [Rubrivivax sp.]